ncbi:Selenocysteine lyase/Cysteine desulfurase [Roseateles sp. YR242]|uniref:aminotransferase class V-fold PLP-dependent enzyme n=1 Tax=Roseateles sp. YR242 TaxID=1855305 RepID=UPI0008BAB586|nr:aminotransferase class V-fold PLP-dependent enzyme [Roseateles sp. YR242]SEK87541.1 Selenocysteine lyase/Cysteine desulfurase [Roseateles sp. YR242]
MKRRDVLRWAGSASVAGGAAAAAGGAFASSAASAAASAAAPAQGPMPAPPATAAVTLPDRASFHYPADVCYLDAGTMHPISRGAQAALDAYVSYRTVGQGRPPSMGFDDDEVRGKFARLINAQPSEIAYVQSTTAGENLILQALGLPERGAHVVVDTLHFFGSLPTYGELARQGVDVTWLRPRDGRIPIEDIERAVRKGTRLVALSQVSTINGFEHDLRRVCEIAHAKGALVYADIVHAAGCVPVDVRATGVDFASCASYKWLMGDFGLGFLYVRKDRQALLRPRQLGYYALSAFAMHSLPFDPPEPPARGKAAPPVDYARRDDAQGLFGIGTYAHTGLALLNHSLDYLHRVGVAAIQSHALTLTARLKEELPRRGYALFTPPESRSPLVTCVLQDARKKLSAPLNEARVRITLSANRFRVSVSVFNTLDDIDQLLAALPRL